MSLAEKIFGTFSDRELKKINPITKKVLALEPKYQVLSDADLQAQTPALKARLAGGETLEVEGNVMDGSGKLILTGNLGDVMKESVQAAVSYLRTRAEQLHIPSDFYKTRDIHVHFPEGAVPKDGPSAGIAVCTALASALSGTPVRRDIAMTGEISIRGRVLPIGGLKEKTMAALRHGVKTVIIPHENEKNLQEIDQTVRRALNFLLVDHADAVLDAALVRPVQEEPAVRKTTERVLPVAQHDTAQPNQGIRQ